MVAETGNVADEQAAPRQSRAVRAAAFDYLYHALSDRSPISLGTPIRNEPDWVALVEQANRERVVTNLYAAFERQGWPNGAPQDLRDYLGLIHHANAEQNRAARDQALAIAAILNQAGAAFVFLKGANWLLEIEDDRIGERWLADLDLVIAPAHWETGLAALEEAGFRPVTDPAIYRRHFHHVPLARPGDRVSIELHRHLGWQRHLLTPEEVIAAAQSGPSGVPLSSPAHRFIYGCLHSQLQDLQYAAGQFSLRDQVDIQYLLARHGSELDWTAIANLAETRGIFAYLAASLYLAQRMLGVGIPAPFAGNRRARAHVSRCLLQHRGLLRPRLTGYAVKLAWMMDSRRLAYELDCETAPWAWRQLRIAGGRIDSVLSRLVHGRRSTPGPSLEAPPAES